MRSVYNLILIGAAFLGRTGPSHAADIVGASLDGGKDRLFPANSSYVINVTRLPYAAKGDGTTDDTAAIQKALNDMMGQHKILYFPNGVYLVSAPLQWSNRASNHQPAWGYNWIQGQDSTNTVIRLKDGTFPDPANPRAMMWCGGFGSADWFHNYVQGMTFNTGRNNAGAIGLQFYSNNTGAVRDVAIVSPDGKGLAGLDLVHRNMNGPLLVRNLVVRGFEVGIRTGHAVNSQTFEKITLIGQTQAGVDNTGQAVSIRQLKYSGPGTGVRSYGTMAIIEAEFVGRDAAKSLPAIVNYNGGRIFLRDVTTSGFARALSDVVTPDYAAALRVTGDDKPGSLGPQVREYFSHSASNPFAGVSKSLRLPVAETPDVPWDSPEHWAVVDQFGADPTGTHDSSDAIQRAFDSGATTVFFPGFYALKKPVMVRGKVRRVIGVGGWLDYNGHSRPDIVVKDGDEKVVVIEHLCPINGGVEIETDRTVVLRSVEAHVLLRGKGRLFLEDVATSGLKLPPGLQAWARQLNIENEGTHLTNDGGTLWVLGYKTERGGTLLHTLGAGQSEVFGNVSYTTTAGRRAPMFVTTESSAFAFFGEVCFTGDPFAVLIRETRDGESREVKRGEGATTPYFGVRAKREK